jgi:predicted O-methyltransferase YrrM
MDEMNEARWRYTHDYLAEVFGVEDAAAAATSARSREAGLAPIAVSSDVGRLLTLLAGLSGARTAIEIGTLGGYSALHIVQGLGPGGRLITIDRDTKAVEIARRSLAQAGVGDRVRCEVGAAADVLPRVAAELGAASVGFAFMDADKTEYAANWTLLRPLVARGGLVVVDNVLGTRRWWIDEETHPSRVAVDAFNRALAADPDFDVAAILARQGLLVARRR